MTWYAVQTRPRQESVAVCNLQRLGYDTYLPKIRVRKRRRQQWCKVVEPLFSRYLFINVTLGEQSTASVRSTRGVVGLVRFGTKLQSVPEHVISYLRQNEENDTSQRADDRWPHKPGDVVQVLQGPFAGLSGVYQMEKDDHRALLFIELLGRRNTVVVAQQALG
jgi:transcriptional antiterminator RfaH